MPDIKQPELPEPSLRQGTSFPDGEGADCDMWDADQMHAHYAKGREDERAECAEEIAYKAERIEQLENSLLEEFSAHEVLKQSLAQLAQDQTKEN